MISTNTASIFPFEELGSCDLKSLKFNFGSREFTSIKIYGSSEPIYIFT